MTVIQVIHLQEHVERQDHLLSTRRQPFLDHPKPEPMRSISPRFRQSQEAFGS